MTIEYFDREFSDRVIAKIICLSDEWLKKSRQDFLQFLQDLYDPMLINQVGLVTMKTALKNALLEQGQQNVSLLVVLVYLLSVNPSPAEMEVIKYQTVQLNIISLTDVSLVHHADFSQSFLLEVQNIVKEKFL